VIGVSALAEDGSVPAFWNFDRVYHALAAPGVGIVSTLPRSLTAARSSCIDQGYSTCGPPEFRAAEGTSYAAAEVSGAAALLIAMRPSLSADQVTWLLERSADDVNAATGCKRCPLLRDLYSGWGKLDIAAALRALDGTIPPPDRYEGNDDAGDRAFTLYGRSIDIAATLDFWDDQIDVYRIKLRKGQTVAVSLRGPAHTDTHLILWKPGTLQVEPRNLSPALQTRRVTQSVHVGPNEHFLHRARQEGWYYVEVKMSTPGEGQYRLHISKSQVAG
jgi:serine protease